MTHPLRRIVLDLIDEFSPPSTRLSIGLRCKHPDGRQVQITSGCFLDPTYGRVSNFWYWREVLPSGKLSEREEHGYGWEVSP